MGWRRSASRAGLTALAIVAGGANALAASDHGSGDGSDTGNTDLLRHGAPMPITAYPGEPYEPLYDLNWSIGLRGAYTVSNSGGGFETQVSPSVSGSLEGSRWTSEFSADAVIVHEQDGQQRLSGIELRATGDYQLDSLTLLEGEAAFSVSQDGATPDGTPTSVAVEPLEAQGSLDGAVTRQFGRFALGLRGNLERDVTGPSTLTDSTIIDNSDQNRNSYGGGLRASFEATPIWSVFADAGVDWDVFDQPSKTLLVKLDSSTYALKAGVAGQWNEVFSAEASVGLALRRFSEPGLDDVPATLYDASISFRPDPTLTLNAGFATTIEAPGSSSGSSKINYAATADVEYQLNPWLALRANAGWKHAAFSGSASVETGYDFGIGADYQFNAHTALTADYAFTHTETTPDPGEDEHLVALGLRLSR